MEGGDWKAGVGMALCVLIGATLAMLSMPAIFAAVPTDLERTRVLLRAGRTIQGTKPAVVLGNSVAMNGVDTALIGPDIPNLSSTGQSVSEGFLHLQIWQPRAKCVVLFVAAGNFETDGLPPKDVLNAFYMNGFRASTDTLEPLAKNFDYPGIEMLHAADLAQRFASRWVLSQALDTILRQKLRKDLETSKSIQSLTYPAPYTKPISPEAFERLLPTYLKERTTPEFSPLPAQVGLVREIAERTPLLVVLAPMHPRRLAHAGPAYGRSIESFALSSPFGPKVPILNLTELLGADEYIDVVHPTRSGAERVSGAMREFLKREQRL